MVWTDVVDLNSCQWLTQDEIKLKCGYFDACVELVCSLTRVRWETEDKLVSNELCVVVSDLTSLNVFNAPNPSSVEESHTCSTALAIVIRSFGLCSRSWRIKSLPVAYR